MYKAVLTSLVLTLTAPVLAASNAITLGPSAPLTNAEIQREIRHIPAKEQPRLMADAMAFANFVDQLDLRRALTLEAERMGLGANEAVQNELRIAYETILIQHMRRHYIDNLELPDFTPLARERYQADKKQHVTPEQREASHILLTFTDEADKAEKREQLESFRAQLKSGKADFAELAKEHSADKGSGAKGGSLGEFGRNVMVKPFEDAAFALKKEGDISEVVETRFGLHLIRLDKITPARQLAYDEVKDDLIKQVRSQFIQSSIAENERAIMQRYTTGMDVKELFEFYQFKPAEAP